MVEDKGSITMSDEGIWSTLGDSLFIPSTMMKRVVELEDLVESLVLRLDKLEGGPQGEAKTDPFDSTQFLDISEFIPKDDNEGEREDIEIRVITGGFVAPTPESEKVSVEKTAYLKYKGGELPWTEYVRLCNGVKRAVAIRDEVEGSAEEE